MKKILVFLMCAGALLASSKLEKYQKGCDEKDGKSCFMLGFAYNGGTSGVKQDYKQASKYFKLGCDLSHSTSCFSLGLLHTDGRGVKQDTSKAKHYLKLSCEQHLKAGCDKYDELNKKF